MHQKMKITRNPAIPTECRTDRADSAQCRVGSALPVWVVDAGRTGMRHTRPQGSNTAKHGYLVVI